MRYLLVILMALISLQGFGQITDSLKSNWIVIEKTDQFSDITTYSPCLLSECGNYILRIYKSKVKTNKGNHVFITELSGNFPYISTNGLNLEMKADGSNITSSKYGVFFALNKGHKSMYTLHKSVLNAIRNSEDIRFRVKCHSKTITIKFNAGTYRDFNIPRDTIKLK